MNAEGAAVLTPTMRALLTRAHDSGGSVKVPGLTDEHRACVYLAINGLMKRADYDPAGLTWTFALTAEGVECARVGASS